ncbi:MAG: DnaJ domain-containing protein [Desulfurivibrionaceae bacterium]|jgi:DnaJ like chaperone protein|nr:TerB family tellurite resistance protein [Pseudomonadota bacterium]MCG2822950.1 DnaJ domain-containing protein [Desulfobulbaceae bacterium]MDP2002952.1 DnaJ domain-containing protein [Desulfurivibrionaceae bacterium]MDP2757664.1 DnaJ domain-containing protein [Desulfurivibrionaceae bacterium]PKN21756.1 MAG: molecular chaperone DnaJ [Deltaproteobacteria bacterium HGW-Deltaproteobacteria-3]
MIVYRSHKPPGCGGFLLVVALLLFLVGGAPLILDVLGFLFFTGVFLVLMVFVGIWGFSQYIRRMASRYERSQTESHNQFVFLLVNILIRIAQADGVVTKGELAPIENFFRVHLRYNQSQMYWVRDLIQDALASQASLEAMLSEFKSQFAYEPRLILVELIYQVLYTNEQVSPQELAMVQTIADFLGIAAHDHHAIRSKYVGPGHGRTFPGQGRSERQYYEILGLEPGATPEQIKSAYRKLSMQYHPDKVAHLGEEFRRVAEEKMKELNEAYQHLKKTA